VACHRGASRHVNAGGHVVIIVSVDNRLVGLLADRVLDIVYVEVAKIQPVPHLAKSARVTFLAGLVTGLTPVHTCRVLSSFRKNGICDVGHGSVKVMDRAELQRIAATK
jgi:hypothetical protein